MNHFDPRWSFVAVDSGGEVCVGYAMTGRPALALGFRPYIYLLGVAEAHRGRSVASALVGNAVAAASASGASRIGLDADMSSPDRAHSIMSILVSLTKPPRFTTRSISSPLGVEHERSSRAEAVPLSSFLQASMRHGAADGFSSCRLVGAFCAWKYDNPPYRTSSDEVKETLSSASHWRGLVGICAQGIAAGRLVAFARVVLRFPGRVGVCASGSESRLSAYRPR